MLFSYFVYIAHLTKFTRGRSLLMEKSLLREKSKRKKILAKKKHRHAMHARGIFCRVGELLETL